MKKNILLAITLVLVITLLLPGTVSAKSTIIPVPDGKVIFGGTYTLRSGETLNDTLVVVGGVVVLEEGSSVKGDVIVILGSLTLNGEVIENVVAIGGVLSIGENAILFGDLIAPGTALNRAEGAKIYGDIITDSEGDFKIPGVPEMTEGPDIPVIPEPEVYITPLTFRDRLSYVIDPIINIFWFFFRVFALAAVVVLLLMFFPKNVERANRAIIENPAMAGGMGCLTLAASPILMLILSITLILIPITAVYSLVLMFAIFLGWIPVGQEVGRRVVEAINKEFSLPLQAAIGVSLLFVLVSGFGYMNLPFIGFLLSVFISSIGLGSVLMTRFGTREYVQAGGISVPQATLEALGISKKSDKHQSSSSNEPVEEVTKTESKPKNKPKEDQ